MVINLISDLIRKADVRAAFNQDPNAVMASYVLSNAEKCIVYSMNPKTIADAVHAEVMAITTDFMEGEFPPMDENCLPEPFVAIPTYPIPTPEVFRLRPRKVSIADYPDGVFELNVYGQSFSRPSRIKIKKGNDALVVAGQYIFGTYRCSHARGAVTLTNEGDYKVFIELCPGEPGAFDIEAPYKLEITA